jgi:hypothetical protein
MQCDSFCSIRSIPISNSTHLYTHYPYNDLLPSPSSQLGLAQSPPKPNIPNPLSISRSPFPWHGACSAGGYSNSSSSSKEEKKTKKGTKRSKDY